MDANDLKNYAHQVARARRQERQEEMELFYLCKTLRSGDLTIISSHPSARVLAGAMQARTARNRKEKKWEALALKKGPHTSQTLHKAAFFSPLSDAESEAVVDVYCP